MSVTYVGAGALSIVTTGIATPAVPAGVKTGDLLLLLAGSDNQTITLPTSSAGTWIELGNQANQGTGTPGTGNTSARLGLYYKRYNGETSASIANTGNVTMGRMLALRGTDPINPIFTSSFIVQAATTSDTLFDRVAPVVANTFLLYIVQTGRDTNSTNNYNVLTMFQTGLNPVVSNQTKIVDQTSNTGNGGGFIVFSAQQFVAGLQDNGASLGKSTAWSDGVSGAVVVFRSKRKVEMFSQ